MYHLLTLLAERPDYLPDCIDIALGGIISVEGDCHLLTNCSQSILPAMVCRLSLLVLNTSLAKCESLGYAMNESFAKSGVVTACDWLKGLLWDNPCLHFYREVKSGGITDCKGNDTT